MSELEQLDYDDEHVMAGETSSSHTAYSKDTVDRDQNDQAPVTQQQFTKLVTGVQNLSNMVKKPKSSKCKVRYSNHHAHMHDKRQKSSKMSDSDKDDMSISSEDDPVDDFYSSDQSEFNKGDDISEVENPDEILEKLASEYDQGDTTGEKLASASLAKLVNKIMYTPIHDKKVKEKMERHSRPSNCANMKATKVDQGVYRKMKEYTTKRNVHFYKLQQSLLSGITAITRIADMTTKSKTLD